MNTMHYSKQTKPSLMALMFILSLVSTSLISSCKKEKLSPLTGFLSFDLKGMNESFSIDQIGLNISNQDSLPYKTDVTHLIAEFQTVPNCKVYIGSTIQESGVTTNDFSNPVTYTVVAQNGSTKKDYMVTVNVAKIDSNAVSWKQVTSNGGWGPFNTTQAGYFNSKFWIFGEKLGYFNSYTQGVFSSSDGSSWTPQLLVDNYGDSIPHVQHTALVTDFNNKMWLLGGHAPGVGFNFDYVTNEIWSSSDGITWTADTTTNRWSPRERLNSVVFDNKIWVIGGNGYPAFNTQLGIPYNDVWSSSDGVNWSEVTASANFTPRTLPSVFVYDGKIWLTGGLDNNKHYLNDVWNTSDGANWTKVNVSQPFSPRFGHKTVVYNDELFMIGGEDSTGVLNDLWVSDDGAVTWKKIESGDQRVLPANFKARTDFSMFVYNNAIWIIGGRGTKTSFDNYAPLNDTWEGTLVKPH